MTSGAVLADRQDLGLAGESTSALNSGSAEGRVPNWRERVLWDRAQQQYWDGLASDYDCLYEGSWSRTEDAWVASQLSFIADLRKPTIVDLGCGTGLGWRLIEPINPSAEYYGIDISPSMAQAAASDDIEVKIGSMEDLGFLDDASVDVVIALFSSLSFAFDPALVMGEISRILRPSGHAYLSALSRGSLSRFCNGITRGAQYWTRGDSRLGVGAPAHFFSIEDLKKLGGKVGLTARSATGMNSFSGVCELPFMWSIGRFVAAKRPDSAHLVEVHFQKGGVSVDE